jgi:hypothetical protein
MDLAAQRASGELRGPSGTVWLSRGAVVRAHSPLVPEACLLAGAWFGDRIDDELAWNTRLLDAAYFALGQADGPFDFRAELPPDGRVRTLRTEVLCYAIGRRRALLDQVLPRPDLDTAAVAPAAPGGRSPSPGRRLCALLAAADGQLTPPELASRLGRSTFSVLLDIRLLAGAGLLRLPSRAAPARPADSGVPSIPPAAPGLPRRQAPAQPSERPPADPSDPNVALLLRIRAALEARL